VTEPRGRLAQNSQRCFKNSRCPFSATSKTVTPERDRPHWRQKLRVRAASVDDRRETDRRMALCSVFKKRSRPGHTSHDGGTQNLSFQARVSGSHPALPRAHGNGAVTTPTISGARSDPARRRGHNP
jgi:hypothetical protein